MKQSANERPRFLIYVTVRDRLLICTLYKISKNSANSDTSQVYNVGHFAYSTHCNLAW